MPNISEKQEARSEKRKSGFTLIEILIAISIISIISAIGMVSYSQSQLLARDAKRKQDLRAIAVALEIYKQANPTYPVTSGACCTTGSLVSSSAGDPWVTGLSTSYINSVPRDPRVPTASQLNPLSASSNLGYSYWAGTPPSGLPCPSNSGSYYILAAGLENGNDPQAHGTKQYKDCAGNLIGSNNSAFIITSQ